MYSAKIDESWSGRMAPACRGCRLREQCFLAVPLPEEDGDCAGVVQRRFALARGGRLYRRNDAFGALFQVCSGSVKTQRETADGGLVVTGFFLPGDVVGIEAISGDRYPSDAVAIADSEVCQLDFARLLSSCTGKPGLQSWVISRIGFYVRRKDNDLSWSTGLQTHQRVLRFFLDLYERLSGDSEGLRSLIELPMQKQDIARYLHITPETLSRNLAQLRREGLLQLEQDRFVVPDAPRARRLTQL
jgi:CRP/FNR family transcriptional regulator